MGDGEPPGGGGIATHVAIPFGPAELTERGYRPRDTLTDADEAVLPPFAPPVFALRSFFPPRPPPEPR